VTLAEYQYLRNTWFQIEPFRRFDGLIDPPVLSAAQSSYTTLITFTSEPAAPASWQPHPVPLDSSSFALYLDDQNPPTMPEHRAFARRRPLPQTCRRH
jgi:hypothetical protein